MYTLLKLVVFAAGTILFLEIIDRLKLSRHIRFIQLIVFTPPLLFLSFYESLVFLVLIVIFSLVYLFLKDDDSADDFWGY